MSTKAIKLKAAEHLGYGLPKQQTFDLLMAEFPEARPKKVAEILRYMPTLQARERYRNLHLLLLAAIALHGLLRVLRPVLEPDFDWTVSHRLMGLVPIASVLLAWSIWRWQGQVFEWVGWMNVLGAAGMLKMLAALNNGDADVWPAGLSTLSVGIGALALYLGHKVFAKPKVEKDPLGGPGRVVFPEEGMG